MQKMKVYRANLDGRFRGIVAATSQRSAAELLGISLSAFRNYGGETGNAADIAQAMKEPGVAWKQAYASNGGGGEWQRIERAKSNQADAMFRAERQRREQQRRRRINSEGFPPRW